LAFAEKVLTQTPENSTLDEKLHYAFRTALMREPTRAEMNVLRELYNSEKKDIEADKARAGELLSGITGYKPSTEIGKIQLAIWFSIANTLLNLDETITKS